MKNVIAPMTRLPPGTHEVRAQLSPTNNLWGSVPGNKAALSPPGASLTSLPIMKRLNSPKDDNVPVYIFVLLFTILLLSYVATADIKRYPRPRH
ncbi:Branched-chain alpha-ketoacid dehydrogenase kinase/Pyruvate dehydrogenase kinase N-terminal [Penicillium chermesinum]|nr:Branched-chain alpha-ketoacid dehydrogenase kinase/Pyruvate dehydrogenase kinase N-terminal [Penicillium chermesinum]